MMIRDGQTVLFQGDSVTDAGRSRENDDELGAGYPGMVAARFHAARPYMNVRFINRGVSGNRVADLARRWREDCIDLRPDIVSILIGINDCWRRYDANDPTPAEKYEEEYRGIVGRTIGETGARVMILEPFVLPFPEDRKSWRVDLDPKIHAARRVAAEFGALFVPLDGLFAACAAHRPAAYWAADGVHPTFAGHTVIADAWLRAVGAG